MTDPYFNLQDLPSDFQTAYDAVMSGSRLPSNGCVQKKAIAFGQQVKQTSPNDYLKTSVPDKHGYHNQFSYSRLRVEGLENLSSSASASSDGEKASGAAGKIFTSPPKHMPITSFDSEELCQDEASEVPVKPGKANISSGSAIKIVFESSMDNKEGSHFVNNSLQYSNIQTSPNIQADNLGNEFVRKCSTKKNAIRHQRIHKGEKPYKCNYCDKYFIHSSGLLLHQRIHTGEKLFECEQCDRSFTLKGNLTAHRRTHTGEKPFECGQCNKSFAQKGNMIAHRRTHTAKKPYKCKQCGMCFARQQVLTTHQRIHTGEKFYRCSECDKIFAQKRYLATHLLIHTGVKPYKCGQCDKHFTKKSYLTLHQRAHAGTNLMSASNATKSWPLTTHSR